MSPDAMMMLFNLIIFIFGTYGVILAVRMKKSGKPPSFLISEEEAERIEDVPGFCYRLYMPTLVLGIAACVYGILMCCIQYLVRQHLAKVTAGICFLAVCMWYVRKLQSIKEAYMS